MKTNFTAVDLSANDYLSTMQSIKTKGVPTNKDFNVSTNIFIDSGNKIFF